MSDQTTGAAVSRSKRELLAEEANLLRAIHQDQPNSWYVGRTDMQSYNSDGVPEHYAYGPYVGRAVLRVRFLGADGDEALEKAIAFCRAMTTARVVDVELLYMT